MNISEALSNTITAFKDAGIELPELDAYVLLTHLLKTEKYRLITDSHKLLSRSDISELNSFTKRRINGEPVAYITGRKEFYSIEFHVTKDVLIPRPETEQLVDLAIFYAKKDSSVLDIGTGSGAIAIALKKNRPDLSIYASDISDKALAVAKNNARTILGNQSVTFLQSDLFHAFLRTKFDIILTNPPYIDPASKESLQKELFFEPEISLFAGEQGNAVIRRIISEADGFLNKDGLLIMEIGGQDSFIRTFGNENDYSVSILKDYANLPRIALLQKNK